MSTKLDDLRTLSLRETVEATGLSERTLRSLVSTRRIPYVKVGKFVRFKPADLAAWIDENTREASA
ncbi:helix-turn-helix domain-containing protein [Microbacterium sp. MC2]